MRAGLKIFNYLGAPVNVHISVVLVFIYFYMNGGIVTCIMSGFAFIALMTIHEMGHAYFVRKYKHDLMEIRIYPILGACLYEYDERYTPETLIFAGGLLAQLVILAVWLAIIGFISIFGLNHLGYTIKPLTNVFIDTNILLLILNSLPVPGLDGFELWKRFIMMIKMKFKKLRSFPENNKKEKYQSPEKVVNIAIKRAQKNRK